MSLFTPTNIQPLDPTKENVVCFINKNAENFRDHWGFAFPIIDALKEKYNLLFVVLNDRTFPTLYPNCFVFNNKELTRINETEFKRVKESDNSRDHNQSILEREFEHSFGQFKIHRIILLQDYMFALPLIPYVPAKKHRELHDMQNEYFDYVGDDNERMNIIDETNASIVENFNERVSVIAFSMWDKNLFSNLVLWMYKKNKEHFKMLYTSIIDPGIFFAFFEMNGIPLTNYYFVDDKRGTRNLSAFPLAELQHLVYEEPIKDDFDFFGASLPTEIEKDKDFIFFGSIFYEKGPRLTMWDTFLRDLDASNAELYIPLKANGVYYGKLQQGWLDKAKTIGGRVYDEVVNHPCYKGYLHPDNLYAQIQRFKYSLILRCVSTFDSLNFRPVLYAKYNILPFFDVGYDPEYLQIPKEIQDKLIVKNSVDIMAKMDYYNSHDAERLALLKSLRDHFNVDFWLNRQWSNDDITKYYS